MSIFNENPTPAARLLPITLPTAENISLTDHHFKYLESAFIHFRLFLHYCILISTCVKQPTIRTNQSCSTGLVFLGYFTIHQSPKNEHLGFCYTLNALCINVTQPTVVKAT